MNDRLIITEQKLKITNYTELIMVKSIWCKNTGES